LERAAETQIIVREAIAADIPAIMRVRTSVTENALTLDQLEQRGITDASIAASFLTDSKGWVAVQQEEIVAFSIADRASGSLFALFVLPAYAGRGIGGRLLDEAVHWLWNNGIERIWLTTAPGSRACRFYETRGWERAGMAPSGDIRYERRRHFGRRS
jgi:GNAT superfamily N-acetyltransferase